MKILTMGLSGAAPELLMRDHRLTNLQRLMDSGCYGQLESVAPPIAVPAWMCMATSKDPGSLGVYGFRNRTDYSYDRLQMANSQTVRGFPIWDQIAREGGKANIVAVPSNFPPRRTSGVSVGCLLTPNNRAYTYPESVAVEISNCVGHYPVDVPGFRTHDKTWLKEEIYRMSRKHFQVVRHLLEHTQWDYFHFVEIGLDRIQHGFWKYHDPEHCRHQPGTEFTDVIRDYYEYLDEEIGSILELLDDDTAVLVVSDHGAQRLDGAFCVNEWLFREGDLALHHYPRKVTPMSEVGVDWRNTQAWSEGGYYARVFLNVKGREPQGSISPQDYEKVREDLKDRLEATVDDRGRPLGTVVFRPEDIYREVNGVAPDLIVNFGKLSWRSVGGVGYADVRVQENDTGPDDCNHAQYGAFILAAPNNPLHGELRGVHLLDISPTLLDLGGHDCPESMQGSSLLEGQEVAGVNRLSPDDDEEIIRRQLSGLGYI